MVMAKKDKEVTAGEFGEYPNEKWKKFCEKFKDIETLDVKDWKPAHILGYFCKKYEAHYGIKYQLKFNKPTPTGSFELYKIGVLSSTLTSNPALLKSYIDWVFNGPAVKAKRRSIGFIVEEYLVNDYKWNVLMTGKTNNNIDRSMELPENYQVFFQEAGVSVKTYGDLAFLSQMSDMSFEVTGAFLKLEAAGFDKEILNRIV